MNLSLTAVAAFALLSFAPAYAESVPAELCTALAASPYDEMTPGDGVVFNEVDAPAAIHACEVAVSADPGNAVLQFQLGRAYDVAGDAEKALAAYDAAGTPLAFYSMGAIYEGGYGVKADPAKAFDYYSRAAQGEIPIAIEALGRFYENGIVVPQDHAAAARLYTDAMERGFAPAAGALGYLYETGIGMPKDEVRALELYRVAADAGEAFAIHNVAVYHEEGRGGLEVDMAEAVRLYEIAAAADWAPSMLNLANAYEAGSGVAKDIAQAERYLRRVIDMAGDLVPAAQNDLAWLFAVERRNLDEAENLARSAVAAVPAEANYLDTLAWVLHVAGRDDEALVYARKAVEMDGKASYQEHLAAIEASSP